MAKLKVTVIAVALLAFVTIVVRQQWRTNRLLAEADVFREQVEEAAAVEEENRRLTEQLQARVSPNAIVGEDRT